MIEQKCVFILATRNRHIMLCTRCGTTVQNGTRYCPICGSEIETMKATNYGYYPSMKQEQPAHYDTQEGYPHSEHTPASHPTYTSYNGYDKQQNQSYHQYYRSNQSYNQTYQAPGYAPPVVASSDNNNALIVEVVLSLFGIFGVGWLLAGETTAGIILLICSIIVYWPFMIFGTLLTFGFGLICLGPLAIATIIINTLIFNSILRRKIAARQTPPPMPPPLHY
jgi:uncharacterized Zn finger protein (UPF0148 family)